MPDTTEDEEQEVPVLVVRSFRNLAIRHLGLDIPSEWEPLVAARIAKRMQHLKLPMHRYLCRLYQKEEGIEEISSFWQLVRPRPAQFFDRWPDVLQLRSHVERKLAQGVRQFRFWSAGCGSGEVACAMGMTTLHVAELQGIPSDCLDLKILVTDICNAALEAGERGIYEPAQVQQVTADLRARYLHRIPGGVAIVDAIRTHLTYRYLNLAQSPFPLTGPFDAIFCHEGLAPLVSEARQRIIPALQGLLAKDGVFCAGIVHEPQCAADGTVKGGGQGCVPVASRAPGDC